MYKIFTTSLALAFASLVSAQTTVTVLVTTTVTNVYTSSGAVYSSTSQYAYPTATSVAAAPPAATHTIQVGPNGTLTYSPNNINATVGDTVQFFFSPKNHTVTQSNFANPCEPLSVSTGVEGISTGFTHNTTVSQSFAGFSFTVNDTNPIWLYCSQKNPESHCVAGMVMAINAPGSGNKTFDNFLALAKASNSNSSVTPSGASGSPSGTATGVTPSSTSQGGGGSGSGALSTSVNVGLTAFLAVVGFVMLAL